MTGSLRVENQEMARAVIIGFEGILAHDPDDLAAQAAPSGGLAFGPARWLGLDALESVACRANRGGGIAVRLAAIGRRHEHDAIGSNWLDRPRRGRSQRGADHRLSPSRPTFETCAAAGDAIKVDR